MSKKNNILGSRLQFPTNLQKPRLSLRTLLINELPFTSCSVETLTQSLNEDHEQYNIQGDFSYLIGRGYSSIT